MKNQLSGTKAATVLTALMLLLTACGGGSATDEGAPLPPNDNPGDTPAVEGPCAEGEPDCNDFPVAGDEAPLGDGGLSVLEALTGDATGVIAVQGFLLEDGTGARLCETLAESYPPQCGGASIPLIGYEGAVDVPLSTAQGVVWTDQSISLLGEIVDGTLVVDPTVAG